MYVMCARCVYMYVMHVCSAFRLCMYGLYACMYVGMLRYVCMLCCVWMLCIYVIDYEDDDDSKHGVEGSAKQAIVAFQLYIQLIVFGTRGGSAIPSGLTNARFILRFCQRLNAQNLRLHVL